MTISFVSASRRYRERSSFPSERGTSFTPGFRTERAMSESPILPRSPRLRPSYSSDHRIHESRRREAGIEDVVVRAIVCCGFGSPFRVLLANAFRWHCPLEPEGLRSTSRDLRLVRGPRRSRGAFWLECSQNSGSP